LKLERSELVGGRVDLARLANQKNLKVAVEVGTDRGEFAVDFLDKWTGEMLFCVDPWAPYEDMPWDRTGDLMLACAALARHHRRVRLLRTTSEEAARYLSVYLNGIGLVYLDGAHDFENVARDIRAWWPLVIAGGVLAGDDFDDQEHEGVIAAVLAFAKEQDLTVRLTTDYNRFPSWYIEKAAPEPTAYVPPTVELVDAEP
jgi:hypothetical protein